GDADIRIGNVGRGLGREISARSHGTVRADDARIATELQRDAVPLQAAADAERVLVADVGPIAIADAPGVERNLRMDVDASLVDLVADRDVAGQRAAVRLLVGKEVEAELVALERTPGHVDERQAAAVRQVQIAVQVDRRAVLVLAVDENARIDVARVSAELDA